jgi:hypothetical protein
VTVHSQGLVDGGCLKVIRCNEKKNRFRLKENFKKVNKGKFFFSWIQDNDVKVKCIWSTEKTQGQLWKTKLVKTCGVASVVRTAMSKGFAESPIKKGYEW